MNAAPPVHVTEWELPGSDGEPILGHTHHSPDGSPAVGRLVICHGFKGYMDYGFLPRLADHAARLGVESLRFNFSHSGVTRQYETFARPDLFERDTWNRQVFDLTQVVEHFGKTDKMPLILFGHSRGGVAALLAASRLAADRIHGLITAASPADASRLPPEQAEQLHQDGRIASPSGRTGQLLYVGREWLTEIEADPAGHDPVLALSALACPTLLLHGDQDDTVPAADLERFAAVRPQAQTHLITGANHVFNAPNPMPGNETPSPQTAQLFEHVARFVDSVVNPAER
ncbi:MAG: alpha/beta fold hydrolase [Planctomycetota bacterium]